MTRTLRLSLLGALVIQLYVLYLYVPGNAPSLAVPHLDKVVHAAVFALPAALAVLARCRPALVGLALVVHAPVSELVQHLVLPARSGDPWDLVADLFGVVLGLAAGQLSLAVGAAPHRSPR